MSSEVLVEYIIERLDKIEERIDKNNERINEQLSTLLEFKWQIIGGSIGLSAVLSFAITIGLQLIFK